MMLSETTPDVNAFFESYRTTFERFDASAIADLFAYPSYVASDTGEITLTPIAGKQEWVGKLDRLLGLYRAIDASSARILDLAATELSPRLVQAIVHWELHDNVGRVLYDFKAVYTLVQIDNSLRIAAIAHNEMTRYRECVARLRTNQRT